MNDDLKGAIAIAGGFLTLLAIAETVHHRFGPPVEFTRKLVHIGGGVIALLLPTLVASHWTVLVLAIGMGAMFVVSKQLGLLSSVHAIDRPSRGAEFYPVVVYLLFLLAAHQPWSYQVAILNLAVADALAAIIGKRFGRRRFRVENQFKSLEGSAAFYTTSFFVSVIPLCWWHPLSDSSLDPTVGYWHYFLAANLIALLVTCFEAVSQNGQDNLWIPLGTLLVLTKTFQTDIADLWFQNLSFVGILSIATWFARFSRTFEFAGVLIFCLSSYGCWAMGSFDWALPIFIGFFIYVTAGYAWQMGWGLQIMAVTWSVIVPFAILVIANLSIQFQAWEWYRFLYGPFLAAAAVSLTQAVANVIIFANSERSGKSLAANILRDLEENVCTEKSPKETAPSSMGSLRQILQRTAIGFTTAGVIGSLYVSIGWYRGSLPDSFAAVALLMISSLFALVGVLVFSAFNPQQASRSWFAGRALLNLSAAMAIAAAQGVGWIMSWKPE